MIEVKMPRTSDEVEESLIVFWHVEEGDTVGEGDVLVEVQTEKAVFEIEAEAGGTISEILVKRGESAKVGDVLAKMESEVENRAKDSRSLSDNNGKEEKTESSASGESFVRVSPRLRKLAKDLQVNLAQVNGTGKNGAITEEDIRRAAESGTEKEESPDSFSGIRKTIAARMMKSLQESAQLTLTAWADVTELSKKRKESGSKVSWNSLVSYAAVRALEQHPDMNVHVQDNRVTRHDHVHLGMAVDTPEGLYVPVLQEAEKLSLTEMDLALKELAKKMADSSRSEVLLAGSTFTITNLGNYGIGFFTPILNPPEAGILGVGQIEPHLLLENGNIVQRERIPLSLTFDHRIIDGAPAAEFLQAIADQCHSLVTEL